MVAPLLGGASIAGSCNPLIRAVLRQGLMESDMVEWGFLALVVVLLAFSVKVVPQSQNFLVERLGRYQRTLEAGLHLVMPVIETVRHRVDILERQLETKRISTITLDNVTIGVELAILYRVSDASKAYYRVVQVAQAIETTVIGTVRSVIGKTELDGVQSNRRELSEAMETELRSVMEEWGIVLTRVEILDVTVDEETRAAMQQQLNAERTRRALVRQAEGEKQAAELKADADLYTAQRGAEARKTLAEADAYAIQTIAASISNGGQQAVDFEVRKIQADAVRALGEGAASKLIVLPTEVVDSFAGALNRVLRDRA
ncbi:MAG: SPFH/Band 7/PHB domain protein [Rhodocyclaceae bacterium]|nr:SPFH/Band 7/PHB domain protein [Rhodocyclaceae bacterium]